jgi:hypothetical protein
MEARSLVWQRPRNRPHPKAKRVVIEAITPH